MSYFRNLVLLSFWLFFLTHGARASELTERWFDIRRSACAGEVSQDGLVMPVSGDVSAVEANNRAVSMINSGKPESALSDLEAIDMNAVQPEISARILRNRGIVEERLGRSVCAITYYIEALEADPTYRPAIESIGRSILRLPPATLQEHAPLAVESLLSRGHLPAAGALLERVLTVVEVDHDLVSSVVEYLSAARVPSDEYQNKWRPLLMHGPSPKRVKAPEASEGKSEQTLGSRDLQFDSTNEPAVKSVKTIDAIYSDTFDLRYNLRDLPGYKMWNSKKDRLRLAALLELVADQAHQEGDPLAAVSRYRLAGLEDVGRDDAHEAMIDAVLFNREESRWAPGSPPTGKRLEGLLRERKERLLQGVGPAYRSAGIESKFDTCPDLIYSMNIYLNRNDLMGKAGDVAEFANDVNFSDMADDVRRAVRNILSSELRMRDYGPEGEALDDAIKALREMGELRGFHDPLSTTMAVDRRSLPQQIVSIIRKCINVGGAIEEKDKAKVIDSAEEGSLGRIEGNIAIEGGGGQYPIRIILANAEKGIEEKKYIAGSMFTFEFADLVSGRYDIAMSIDNRGATWIFRYSDVEVKVSSITRVTDHVSFVQDEPITVTARLPTLDGRVVSRVRSFEAIEFERIPAARDPWAVLTTVPGVQVDRINVGGNESGQQSQYVGPGSEGKDAVWAVDGVVITDMSAIGASPTYYNFDAFEEMQATTGGSDASLATGGVTLNMVTRRGTNEWRGSGRFIRADDDWQSSLDLPEGDLGQDFDGEGIVMAQESFKQGNRIVSVEDWGSEFGGPIIRDKFWVWVNYGRNDIHLLTVEDVSDFTKLEDYGGKLNAQSSARNSAVLFYNWGDKKKIGRNAGPTRPQPTTWNQAGSSWIWKVEDTHVFSSNFYLSGIQASVDSKRELIPQGGLDGPPAVLDENFIWQNNFLQNETRRPQQQLKLDGNVFFNSGNYSHDLKFGVGYRVAGLESQSLYPGDGVRLDYYKALGYEYNIFRLSRQAASDVKTTYRGAYAQDTLTLGDATLNVGVRYDVQDAVVGTVSLQGVAGFETLPDGTPLLPSAAAPGFDQPFSWGDLVPRLGLTYAMGPERETLLRTSYARFSEQLRTGYALQESLSNSAYAYFYYEDLNGDAIVSKDEIVNLEEGPLFTNNYDPEARITPFDTDPSFSSPITDELILSVEHAVLTGFVVGATVTFRNEHNMVESERLVVDEDGVLRSHQRDDYVLRGTETVALPDGSTSSFPVWKLRDSLVDTGGSLLTNGDRERNYQGISFTFNKRLFNRWMLRGNLTYSDWKWVVPDGGREDPNVYAGGGSEDGGPVLQGSGTGSGSKGSVYINASWSYSVTGMYQVAPEKSWGFNVSTALNGREGYAIPYFYQARIFAEGPSELQATAAADQFRSGNVHVLDFRLEKEFSVKDLRFTVGIELFNALNKSTVIQRQHRLGISTTDHVLEVISPRVFRLGVRFAFN